MPAFTRAAARWHARFVQEAKGIGLDDAELALAAVRGLRQPHSDVAAQTLRDLAGATGEQPRRIARKGGRIFTVTANSEPDEDRELNELLNAGREVLPDVGGSVFAAGVGLGVGTLAGGPVGSLVGALVGPPTARTLRELARRFLSKREEARIGAAALVAISDISERLARGEEPRHDGFFEDARPAADEVLEGVLLVARDSYEERKLPYLGLLYSTVAFTSQISPALAHRLIRLINDLTYRQLVMLAMIDDANDRRLVPAKIELPPDRELTLETLGFLNEFYDLGRRGLISLESGSPLDSIASYQGIEPELLRTVGVGSILVSAARLDRIPKSDRVLRTWDHSPITG